MKRLLSILFVLCIVHVLISSNHSHAAGTLLPATGQTTSYVTADDGALKKGVGWSTPRFTDLTDGTVQDNLTGLVWLKNAGCFGSQPWSTALSSAKGLKSGACGLSDGSVAGDWRLPNVEQLESLVDLSRYSPALPFGHPFISVQAYYYWSSSTGANYTDYAWFVNMSYGYVGYGYKTYNYYVWPVRSGQIWALDSLIIRGLSSFGNQAMGATGAPRLFSLTNTGSTALPITAIAISGANPDQFTVAPGGTAPCTSLTPTLAAGEKCTFNLSFSPSSSGAKTANLTISTGAGSKDIPLTALAYSTVLGMVVDWSTGLPVPGATVTLNTGASVTTDATGAYTFGTAITLGVYNITVTKNGFQTTTVNNLVVTDTASVLADVWLPTVGFLNMPLQQALPAGPGTAYSDRLKVAGGTLPYLFALAWGSLPIGLNLDPATGIISGTPPVGSDGDYTFAVGVTDAALPYASYAETQLTINVAPPLTISTPAALAKGIVATPYTSTIAVGGGSGTKLFTLLTGTLPPGVTLSTAGILSGTPNSAGTYSFTIKVTDGANRTATGQFTITIVPRLLITTTRLSDAFTAVPYSQTLTGTGGEGGYSWELLSGTLPAGITFNGVTGIISGTAGTPMSLPLTLKLTDSGSRSTQQAFTLNVVAPLSITTTILPDAHVGVAYSQPVLKSGGIAPYSFGYSGQLPPGLALDAATGVISGTPSTSGFVNFGITLSDGTWPTPQNAGRNLSIRSVIDLPLTVNLTGNGMVTSTPPQVSCATGTCNYPVGTGYTLLLHAEPAPGSLFSGWNGACSGMNDCSILMSAAKSVTATFGSFKTLNVTTAGDGTVNSFSPGINCPGNACSHSYPAGESVTLLETPSSWALFKGWSGDCSGYGTCTFSMDTAKGVLATFAAAPRVMIGAADYPTLQDAYNVASDKAVIQLLNDVNVGTLTADHPVTITVSGGNNAEYTVHSGSTEIQGPVTLRSGTVIFEGVTVR